MLVPQLKIFQEASYKTIEDKFDAWVLKRLDGLKDFPDIPKEDVLGIPSETHLQYDQGLQKYIFTVVYMHPVNRG